jgi:hypothetical protein
MEQFTIQHGHLDESQAVLVVEMAIRPGWGGTEDYVVTRSSMTSRH